MIFFLVISLVATEFPSIGTKVLPVQQPILINGGELAPVNVFHEPLWMSSSKSEDSNVNTQSVMKLSELNAQLDMELEKFKRGLVQGNNQVNQNSNNVQNNRTGFPSFIQTKSESNIQNNILDNQLNNQSINQPVMQQNQISGNSNFKENNNLRGSDFPKIASLNKESNFNFISNKNSPLCIRREGMLKIRDADQKDKDVVVTYAVLTKDRLSYFVNAKDESSIQGSIELDKIKESLKLINGFNSCFTIKTLDGISDCSVCAESEDSAREWINAITQNTVNCNTLSALNNLSKRGLLPFN